MHAPANTQNHSRSPTPAIVLALALLGGLAAGAWVVVQQVRMAPGTTITAPATPPVYAPEAHKPGLPPAKGEGPGWEALNTEQKLALYPLAERWVFLGSLQKRRWLALAQTFPSLPEEEQTRLHDRMTAWASLSAQQRNQARLNYAVTNRLSQEDKRSQWDAYQALSEEEKRLLAADAPAKPAGAATALRPVAPQKLAKVPAAIQAGPTRANPPKITPVDPHTPRPVVAPASVVTPADTTSSPAAPVVVETNPVATPSATGSSLPPLAPAPSATEPAAAPARPEDLGYQPQ